MFLVISEKIIIYLGFYFLQFNDGCMCCMESGEITMCLSIKLKDFFVISYVSVIRDNKLDDSSSLARRAQTLLLRSPPYLSHPPSLQSALVSTRINSHPQNKLAIRLSRVQHPMRLMDILKIVDMKWVGIPIPILDMPYNLLQRHIRQRKLRRA